MNHTFKSTSDYLEALAKNPRLAVVSVAMAAESLERTRAGVLLMLKSERLNGITIDGSLYVSAESIIEQRQKLSADTSTITKKLERFARQKELTTYMPLMEPLGMRNVSPDRRKFGEILERVSRETHTKHGFLLSTLVCHLVNGKPAMPGEGYWPLAEELLGKRITKTERQKVFEEQLRLIYRHYTK